MTSIERPTFMWVIVRIPTSCSQIIGRYWWIMKHGRWLMRLVLAMVDAYGRVRWICWGFLWVKQRIDWGFLRRVLKSVHGGGLLKGVGRENESKRGAGSKLFLLPLAQIVNSDHDNHVSTPGIQGQLVSSMLSTSCARHPPSLQTGSAHRSVPSPNTDHSLITLLITAHSMSLHTDASDPTEWATFYFEHLGPGSISNFKKSNAIYR